MAKSTRPPVADAVLKVPLSKVELAADKRTVCVTGTAGYIAAHILQRLLAAGHTGEEPASQTPAQPSTATAPEVCPARRSLRRPGPPPTSTLTTAISPQRTPRSLTDSLRALPTRPQCMPRCAPPTSWGR
jgi:hypothetical protein